VSDRPWPKELIFRRADRVLAIAFEHGDAYEIPFELLRVESPSAEVQGHGGVGKALVAGKASVGVADAFPVGRYAVRIAFDDGHDTGIFSWDYLAELGRERDERMAAYLARLAQAGLRR
jgi:DUF971 family protein